VVQGGLSPQIKEARIKCMFYHSKWLSRKCHWEGRALWTYWKNGSL